MPDVSQHLNPFSHGRVFPSDMQVMSHSRSWTYEVPGVQLIKQDMTMSCWLASAKMLIEWGKRFRQSAATTYTEVFDVETLAMYAINEGITNDRIVSFAKRVGLVRVPPMSPTVEALLEWLRVFGPLWVNGLSHIVVIAGVRRSSSGEYEVKVYDPAPLWGGIHWRSLEHWYAGDRSTFKDLDRWASSRRDTLPAVQAVFLRLP